MVNQTINDADIIADTLDWAAQFGYEATAADCHLQKRQLKATLQDGSGQTFMVHWCEVDIALASGKRIRVILTERVGGNFAPEDPPIELS